MELLNQMPPYNLFGLEKQSYENAKVVVIPVPYDSTSSYKSGSKDGPHAIIDASRNIELYNEETEQDISNIGIYTTDELAPDFGSPEGMVERIKKEASIIVNDGKVPLLLGGEHTISIGNVSALLERYKDMSIIYFDAHSDSRDIYMGAKVCHACVARRIMDLTDNIQLIGVRSIDQESARKYAGKILYMKDMHKQQISQIIEDLQNNTSQNVYISIDLDVLDPSEMPSVGTPEPDGMKYSMLVDLLRGVLKSKKLAGMDVVELNPIPGIIAPNYLAAKLIYMALSYSFGGV
jgi:agmatinase